MIQWFSKKLRNRKGFTLIELIVVIAILGILAMIAIPRFTGVRENANVGAIDANLRTVQSAVEILAAERNIVFSTIVADTTGNVTAPEGVPGDRLTAILGNWPTGPGSVQYTVVAGIATATASGTGIAPPTGTVTLPRTYTETITPR